MNGIEAIKGLWRVIAYEENGVQRSNEALQTMARLLILPDKSTPESDGTWGAISYSERPTLESIDHSSQSLKRLVNGEDYERSAGFHIYTGGLLILGKENSIDVILYHGQELQSLALEHSVNQGIYRYDGTNLILCLVDSKTKQRPTAFDSTQAPNQS